MAEEKMTWTPAQEDAIAVDSDKLLVSAAAGSGKTSVLSARIIRKILDQENPLDVSQLLVVTFTKASAADLKKKIGKELRRALTAHPDSKHLRKQLLTLQTAQISTIHSFCFQLIRRYFHKLSLPGKLRIADEAEAILLKDSAMNEVINNYYDGVYHDMDDFCAFADSFVTDRDDYLAKILNDWYEKFTYYQRGIALLNDYADQMTQAQTIPFAKTAWGAQISQFMLGKLDYFAQIYTDAVTLFSSNEGYENKYLHQFTQDLQIITSVRKMLSQENFEGAHATLASYERNLPKLGGGSLKKELQCEAVTFFLDTRTMFVSWMRKEAIHHLSLCNPSATPIYFAQSAQFCCNLHCVFQHFEEILQQEKRQRGILDYTDLEQYTLKLLYSEDGSYSQIAKQLGQEYKEIFIDEYQDVNEMQDAIFRAIGEESHTFMVGDIKQSIYRFRGSDPTLFSHYRDEFPIYNRDITPQKTQTIFLSNNFRCDRAIIETVNLIFSCLFRNNSNRVAYYDQDALVYSKKASEGSQPVTIALLQKAPQKRGEEKEVKAPSDQTYYIATEIRKKLNEGIAPNEIAILMRGISDTTIKEFEKVFSEFQIPLEYATKASLLEQSEIRLILSLLRVLDNPATDISLTAVLLSPIFSFTLDELIIIRRANRQNSLYHALQAYVNANPDFEKGKNALDRLKEYRNIALSEPLDHTLWYLYRETGILQFIYRGVTPAQGDSAKANLMTLYDYAKSFESSSYCGLYRFLLYLKDVMERQKDLSDDKEKAQTNAVQLMTIHKSKGLEFKVCFLAHCEKSMSSEDLKKDIQFCESLGIAPLLRDPNGIVTYQTPLRSAVKHELLANQLDEEMRVLYVALTRAKEKLYVTAECSDIDKTLALCRQRKQYAQMHAFLGATSFIDWILTALGDGSSDMYEMIYPDAKTLQEAKTNLKQTLSLQTVTQKETQNDEISLAEMEKEIQKLSAEYEKRFDFIYPHMQRAKLPTKLSVSQLSPDILDHFDQIAGPFSDQEVQKQPIFLFGQEKTADAAERGTATHLFLQFADFAFAEKFGAEAERNRQLKQKFITQETADFVDLQAIEGFLQSNFYQNLWKKAKETHREIRFNIRLLASDFTSEPEKKTALENECVYVQGIIDCLIQTQDGYYLLDYKTDSFSKKALENPKEVADILRERHEKQLRYYQLATKQLTGEPLKGAYLYSFALQDIVEMPLNAET